MMVCHYCSCETCTEIEEVWPGGQVFLLGLSSPYIALSAPFTGPLLLKIWVGIN